MDEYAAAKAIYERWRCSPRGRLLMFQTVADYLAGHLTKRLFIALWAEGFNLEQRTV